MYTSGSRSGRDERSWPSLMYVVPSSSSAWRKPCAASRVASRWPTTPISASTRRRPVRRATRVTVKALRARPLRALTSDVMTSLTAEETPKPQRSRFSGVSRRRARPRGGPISPRTVSPLLPEAAVVEASALEDDSSLREKHGHERRCDQEREKACLVHVCHLLV